MSEEKKEKKKEKAEEKPAEETNRGSGDPFDAPPKKGRGLFGSVFWAFGEAVFICSALFFGSVIGVIVGVIFPLFLPASLLWGRYRKD